MCVHRGDLECFRHQLGIVRQCRDWLYRLVADDVGVPSSLAHPLVCVQSVFVVPRLASVWGYTLLILSRLKRKVLVPQRPTLLWAIKTNMTADAAAAAAAAAAASAVI